MWLNKVARTLDRGSRTIAAAFAAIAIACLVVMMFYVVFDVFLRYFFNMPLKGSYEGAQIMMTIIFSTGIAWTQKEKGHVAVEIVLSKFSKINQLRIERVIYSLYFVTVVILIWRVFIRAGEVGISNEGTYGVVAPFERISLAPFHYMLAAAFIPLAVVVLSDLFNSLTREMEK